MALAGQFRLKTQTGSKRGQTGHRALTRHLQALLWLRAGVSPSEEETLGSRAVQTHVLIAAISRRRPHQLPRPPRESHLPPKAGGDGKGWEGTSVVALGPVWFETQVLKSFRWGSSRQHKALLAGVSACQDLGQPRPHCSHLPACRPLGHCRSKGKCEQPVRGEFQVNNK